ncbi:MAG: restriction endonuclease subunit S [Clostridiales bacterium]|nr:restriction endonuclease subunit S [Clostridiales bacterium]
MRVKFSEIFEDVTRKGRKLPTDQYNESGKYPIFDQGQNVIAGYTDEVDGLFTDVPAYIFGDHTRVIKYIDTPCFLGADGVKLLKAKDKTLDPRYLYYALLSINIPNTGYNRHFKWLKEANIKIVDADEQSNIVKRLDKIEHLISLRKQQLAKLDELVKARFVEMFGDPITNSKNLPSESMGATCYLKAGITTSADSIHEYSPMTPIPCYGGNGVRGYVEKATQKGDYPIIGRQGALCGNVQFATGEFHATEHAVLVKSLRGDNVIWLYYLLKYMDLYRFHTGAAQPGLAVKTLNTVDLLIAEKELQTQFAAFVRSTDQTKSTIQASIDRLETLKKSLMQEYFG